MNLKLLLFTLNHLTLSLIVPSCLPVNDELLFGRGGENLSSEPQCRVSSVRYPTTLAEFLKVYNGRTFYADGNHLGHDSALAFGTALHAIACGTVRFYGAASGYGHVAVIEHKLEKPLTVTNGQGDNVTITSFLSIYGHIDLVEGIAVGDTVNPDQVIGHIATDAYNGDGAEHLHLGIRLQNAADAKATDSKWFRGYDGHPSQLKWFADPVKFLASLTMEYPATLWHPAGTVLAAPDGSYWMVGSAGVRRKISLNVVAEERLTKREITTTQAELDCLEDVGLYVSPRAGNKLVKFNDASTVYEYSGLGLGHKRWAFISYEAFLSWGWEDSDIVVRPPNERTGFLAETQDQGYRTLREGSLVKSENSSEVSVVSEGVRRPIFNWDTFLALGYSADDILQVPSSTIAQVAGSKGSVIKPEDLTICLNAEPGEEGGGWGDEGEGGAGGGSNVPDGKVLFQYGGQIMPGLHEFQAMWDPPGSVFYDWVPSTFAQCPDLIAGDGKLECLLDMPSGTTNFLFQVKLPNATWWGDMSYDPQGGQGQTIGTVTLTGPNGTIPYVMVSNGTGPLYTNGFVAVIP